MNDILYQVMLPLLAAHMLGDFILQSNNDVRNKKKLKIFLKHIVILTALSYILTGYWSEYIIPVVILISHTIIDLVKRAVSKDNFLVFISDQMAHITVIVLLSIYMQNVTAGDGIIQSFWYEHLGVVYYKIVLLISAFIVTSKVGSIVVTYIIKPIQVKDLQGNVPGEQINTGRLVGQLERIIILILFIADMPAVIGFLITAKSILRYGEIKNEKDKSMVEYVLIGTLISFALGIAVGYLTNETLKILR